MPETHVLPCRFPTTALLLDDNAGFLRSFTLELDPMLAYRLFNVPQAALAYLHQRFARPPFVERCLAQCEESGPRVGGDHLERGEISGLHPAARDPERFAEVAVMVVDYDMPGMNGLEVCQQLKEFPLRKILFTGIGDEKIAVRAFNEGLIDRFILKSERNAARAVNEAVRELEAAHFQDCARLLRRSQRLSWPEFLDDPEFARRFHALCRQHGLIEYYLSAEPAGFLLRDAEGRVFRLLVQTDEDLRAQVEIARDQAAPAELVARLERREAIAYFWESRGFYRAGLSDWQRFLHPPERLEGARTYYLALMAEPLEREFDRASSYDAYLERLDAEASAAS